MKAHCQVNNRDYKADLSKPIDISIPIRDGVDNPNCYFARDVNFTTIKSGDFIGSVAHGGSVNHQELLITPHGNGTHTETYGHLTDDEDATISKLVKSVHCTAQLITLEPALTDGDLVLSFDTFVEAVKYDTDAVIVRTLPNNGEKLTKKYSGSNPPYVDEQIGKWLYEHDIKHFLLDLPSVDKEVDGGRLATHRAFWGIPHKVRTEATITELIYVNETIKDGLYLLNLQVLNIAMDASPSRPVLYQLI